MIALKSFAPALAIACLLTANLTEVKAESVQLKNPSNKITFDLSAISSEGLIGPPNGLRSVSYEFCIPAQRENLKQVQAIDPTVQYSRSRGRIGCKPNQYLCIGHTHQANWQEVLLSLAKLDYVKKIDQFWGE